MIKINVNIIILAVLFAVNSSFAIAKDKIYDTIWEDVTLAFEDGKYIIAGVSNLSGNSVLLASGVIVTTATVSLADKRIRDFSLRNRNFDFDKYLTPSNEFGTILWPGIVTGGVYLTGLAFDAPKVRNTGRMMIEAMALSSFTTVVLRSIIGRARPVLEKGQYSFSPLTLDDDYHSLPSGHVTVAFALATVLSHKVDKWWAYLAFYGFAGSSVVARLNFDQHWMSDLFLASAIGTMSGLAVLSVDNERGKTNNSTDSKLSLYPTLGGMGLSYRF